MAVECDAELGILRRLLDDDLEEAAAIGWHANAAHCSLYCDGLIEAETRERGK